MKRSLCFILMSEPVYSLSAEIKLVSIKLVSIQIQLYYNNKLVREYLSVVYHRVRTLLPNHLWFASIRISHGTPKAYFAATHKLCLTHHNSRDYFARFKSRSKWIKMYIKYRALEENKRCFGT